MGSSTLPPPESPQSEMMVSRVAMDTAPVAADQYHQNEKHGHDHEQGRCEEPNIVLPRLSMPPMTGPVLKIQIILANFPHLYEYLAPLP